MQPIRPTAEHFSKPRTICLQNLRCIQKMTGQAFDVSRSLRPRRPETGTAIENICTKTAQRIYAEYPKHPPFTHIAVCTGNIL